MLFGKSQFFKELSFYTGLIYDMYDMYDMYDIYHIYHIYHIHCVC